MLPKRNFINLWTWGSARLAAELETSVLKMPESPERLEVLFMGMKTLVEQNFSFSKLDQYPRLLLALLDAGQELMRLGSKGVSQYFWLGIFFDLKWPAKKREAEFYRLLLKIMKQIKGRMWIWNARIKHKLALLFWQNAPAEFLSYRAFIALEGASGQPPGASS